MKTFFVATLTITLLLAAFVSSINAQKIEQKTEKMPAQQMPMMGGMMSGQHGMMGQMPMMQGGMMCPMCGKMMGQMPMMGGMMSGQHGMMGQMSMMNMNVPNVQMLLASEDELNLKEEQIKSLKNISVNSQKESINKKADLAIARIELNALLDQQKIDLEPVKQKVREIADLEAELRIIHIKTSTEAKEVLTDEQSSLFKKMIKKRTKAEKKPFTQKAEKPMHQATEQEKHHQ